MTFQSRLFNLIAYSPAVRQSIISVGGTVVTGLIMAFAMIIVSRDLGPEKFGIFSVSIAIMSVISKGMDMGLNQLLPRLLNKWHDNIEKTQQLLGHIILWKMWFSLVTVIISVIAVPFLSRILNYPHFDMLAWSIVGALVLSIYEYVYLLLSAKHAFLTSSFMSVGQAVIKSLGFVVIYLFFQDSINFVSAVYFLSPVVVTAIVIWLGRSWMLHAPAAAPLVVRKEITSFFAHSLIGIIAMTMIVNLDVLLIQKYLDPFETGVYSGASRIASFIAFATASIGSVLNNRVSRYHDYETLKKYVKKSFIIIFMAVIGFLSFLPLSELSVILTIGPEYINGVPALVILVLNAFLSLAIVPFSALFYSVDHPKYFSGGGVLQVIIIIFGNILFLPDFGIMAAAWTKVIATLAFCIYTFFYVNYAMSIYKLKK